MTIVWGHNNFRLKSVEPVELGIFNNSFDGCTFELRQKYGHLFWIPFIPLEKMWVLKKPDRKLYHCPPEITAELKERFPIRTSLWAWTGPLLILAGVVIFSINQKISDIASEKHSKERHIAETTEMLNHVDSAKQNDYLIFSSKKPGENYFNSDRIPLKILAITKDSIKLGLVYTPYKRPVIDEEKAVVADDKYAGQDIKVEKEVVVGGKSSERSVANYDNEIERINNEEDVAALEMQYGLIDSVTIAKSDLKKTISTEYRSLNEFEGAVVKIISKDAKCRLDEVWHIEGPIVKQVRLDDSKDDGKYFELENKGFNVQADSIRSIGNASTWELSKQRNFFNGDVIALRSSGEGDAYLYFSDKNKNVFKFKITKLSYMLKIDQVF